MNYKWLTYFLAMSVVVISFFSFVLPQRDFVPDKNTAIKIAEAVWTPIYKDIGKEKPYNAILKGDTIWVVTGSLHGKSCKEITPKGITVSVAVGGVAYIEIRKSDGKILKVTHGK